ncbi:MAG: hypothetical protein AB7T49_00540 [Oligoflexales bacterium]
MRLPIWLSVSVILAFSDSAMGVTYNAGTTAGVMLQPSSSYYHFVYGGFGQVGFFDSGFLVRGGYAERPEFRSAGFRDQDSVGYALIGTHLKQSKHQNLSAFCGGAKVRGYVKRIEESEGDVNSRSYEIGGVMTAVEYKVVLSHIDIGLSYHAFVGYTSEEELQSYVAWPYNFAFLQAGTSW